MRGQGPASDHDSVPGGTDSLLLVLVVLGFLLVFVLFVLFG